MIASLSTAKAFPVASWTRLASPIESGLQVARLSITSLRLAGQFALLVGVSYAGTAVVQATGIPLPGNLVGMLLLLGMLRLGIIRLDQIEEVASLLVKHLNLFFLPLAVGLMAWSGLLGASGIGLAISLAGSAAVGVIVAGRLSQRLVVASQGEAIRG